MKNLAEHFLRRKGWMILFIFLVTFTAYSYMLPANFKTMDDQGSIVNNEDIKSFANIGKIFRRSFFEGNYYYRPLVYLSYMTEYHFFGLNPLFYNLVGILLHVATAIIVLFLISHIFKDLSVGFFVALLFAIHPIAWEVAANVSGRPIGLCGFFSAAALLLYCLSRGGRKGKTCYFLSLCSFLLALLAKEAAIVFPLVLLSFECCFRKKSKGEFLLFLRRLVPFVVVLILYIILRKTLGMTKYFPWPSWTEHILGITTFLRAVITYLRLFIWPVGLHFDRSRRLLTGAMDPDFIFTLVFFTVLGFTVLLFRKKLKKEFFFFVGWFFINLIPVSQIVAIGVHPGYISAAEHFLYLPSIGAFVLMVLSARWVYQQALERRILSGSILNLAVVGWFIFLFLMTIEQNIFASSEFTMLKRSIDCNPDNARTQWSLALNYAQRGYFKEAGEHFRASVELEPQNVISRIGLGKALCDQDRYLEGIGEYEKIKDAGKWKDLLTENLRRSYALVIQKYRKALEKYPDDARLHYSLGVVYSKRGQIEQAIDQYEEAVGLDPHLTDALFNLASSYEAIGRFPEAISNYERLIAQKTVPDNLRGYGQQHLDLLRRQSGAGEKSQ